MYTPYVRITTGNPYTVLDAAPSPGVNPKNPLGTLYAAPVNGSLPQSSPGVGVPPVMKYVYYNPTSQVVAPVVAPAPVYWKDETFTTVTSVSTEAMSGAGTTLALASQFIAGWLLPNTTSIAGLVAVGVPATPSGLNGSCVWIQVGGFLAGAFLNATTPIGSTLTPAVASWATTATLAGTNPTVNAPSLGRVLTTPVAVTGGFTADILVGTNSTFWGS